MFSLTPWKSLPKGIQVILIIQVFVFVLGRSSTLQGFLVQWGAFHSSEFWMRPWTMLSYQFLHGGIFHFLFNMLLFWMVSVELYKVFKPTEFYTLVFGSGAFAAMVSIPIYTLLDQQTIVLGFSGSIMALLMVYGRLYPERQITLFFVFPMPMKYAVFVLAGIDLFSVGSLSDVAHIVHVMGFLFGLGFALWKVPNQVASNPWGTEGVSSWRAVQKDEPVVRKGNANAETFIEDNIELDALLKKISKKGVTSLSEQEKRKLDEISHKKRLQTGKVLPFHKKDKK